MNNKIIGLLAAGGVAVLGLGVASVLLTAPITVAGVTYTPGLTGNISSAVNDATSGSLVTVSGEKFTANQLGVTVDEEAFKSELANRKLWNVASWGQKVTVPVKVDEQKLADALKNVLVSPVDAGVSFDGTSWVVTPGVNGESLNLEQLKGLLETGTGELGEVDVVETEPVVVTQVAEEFTNNLNNALGSAGFVDESENRIVSLPADVVSSWFTVTSKDGVLGLETDKGKVTEYVSNVLPGEVNRTRDDGVAVTDEAGSRLYTLDEYQDGRELVSTPETLLAGVVGAVEGDTVSFQFPVSVKEDKASVTELYRRAEVDLSDRQMFLYENEKLVATYPIAVGMAGYETEKGTFKVRAQIREQSMGCTPAYNYCVDGIKWVSYFNGDQAFHGAYWHNDFGKTDGSAERSHGCVNLREEDAKFVYYFVQIGTPVTVHD